MLSKMLMKIKEKAVCAGWVYVGGASGTSRPLHSTLPFPASCIRVRRRAEWAGDELLRCIGNHDKLKES